MATETGLDRLRSDPSLAKHWGMCGLVLNQASVASDMTDAAVICKSVLGRRLKALFGPQHGYQGTAQDNMIETSHGLDTGVGLKVYSLYSETRAPEAFMMEGLDTLIVDLQIVGCRIYTFKSTILACLKAAKEWGVRVVVLDRPNPLGGVVTEGRVLERSLHSFVGPAQIPLRHALTPGEFAGYVNRSIGCELDVVTLKGWDPYKAWYDTGRPWILTSPNLPTIDPVYVYPGTVLFEACNVSEGRGTGLPFQFIGHPASRDKARLIIRVKELAGKGCAGIELRAACFEPVFGKWKGRVCHGFQIHIREPDKILSFTAGLAMIRAFQEECCELFAFKQPPYEYEYEKPPLDLILGVKGSEEKVLHLDPLDSFWQEGLKDYIQIVSPFLLYGRELRQPF